MIDQGKKIFVIFFFFWSVSLFPEDFPFSSIPGNDGNLENLKKIEDKLQIFINKDREQNGLDPIYLHDELNSIAEKHNEKMEQAGQLGHIFPGYDSLGTRLIKANISFIRCGENLAQSDIPLASVIHDQFMQSPDHRSNILNPYFTHYGINISSEKKLFYVTETFAQFAIPQSSSEAEFLLKEHLELWFVKQFNYRFVYHRLSAEYARQLSENQPSGKSRSPLQNQWEKFHYLRLDSPDLETIKKKLKEEIEKISLEAISLGVTMGKTKKYPARNYSVAALCFGKYFADFSPEELVIIFVNTLNQWRVKVTQPVLKLNQQLSKQAQQVIQSVPEKQRQQKMSQAQSLLIFSMINPHRIPPDIQKQMEARLNPDGEIGIAIQMPEGKLSYSHQFLVCMVMGK